MTAWSAREHHRFEAAGRPFVYLVPSAAIFELDATSDRLLRTLAERPRTRDELDASFESETDGREPIDGAAGLRAADGLDAALAELARVQAIAEVGAPLPVQPRVIPLSPFPLTTMVLNVTNQCN